MNVYLIDNYQSCFPDRKGRELTDAILGELLSREGIEDRQILRTEEGKPYIASEEIHFSVSHSGGLFACAMAAEPMGIDIQHTKGFSWEKLSRRYFAVDEQAAVEEEGEEAFFRLWTRKEALSKFLGGGLVHVLNREPVLGRQDVDFREIPLDEGIYGSLCVKRGGDTQADLIHMDGKNFPEEKDT